MGVVGKDLTDTSTVGAHGQSMSHWTTEVFVENPEVFRGDLEARAGRADEEVEQLLDLLADEHDLRPATALDVACGVGRHLVPLAENGIEVTGVDLSPEYVEAARERAREAGVSDSVTVATGDMRELDAVGGRYDLVTNLWTSFGFFDEETNRAVLSGMYERVAEGGVLVMELSNKEGMLANFDDDGVSEVNDRLTTEVREYDPATSRVHTTREVFESTGNGYEHVGTMSFDLRTYAPVELRERLLDAGFGSVSLYGSLDGEKPDRESSRVVVVAFP